MASEAVQGAADARRRDIDGLRAVSGRAGGDRLPRLSAEHGLARTLDALARAGKKVVFVHQVPELGFDPRRCLTEFRQLTPRPCIVERAAVDARQKQYREAVRRVLAQHQGVYEFDPVPRLCGPAACSPFDEQDQPVYQDDDHINWRGAERLARELAWLVRGS